MPHTSSETMADPADHTTAEAAASGMEPVKSTGWAAGLSASALAGEPLSESAARIEPLQQKRIQAQLGAGRAKNTEYFMERTDETLEIYEDVDASATLYFRECRGCTYTIDAVVTKILIDFCQDCTFVINGKVITQTLEMYQCERTEVQLGDIPIKTVQADMCTDLHLAFSNKENYDRIVWAGTEQLRVSFADAPEALLTTGYTEMCEELGRELRRDIDQFIVRFIEEHHTELTVEAIIRLNNGFPSTHRERAEFEERQEKNMRELAKRVYGDDIVVPKKASGPKIKPNEKCPCGSGKKYKKCCRNRKGVTFTQEQVDAVRNQ